MMSRYINAYDYRNKRRDERPDIFEGYADCVGGYEGVFAVMKHPTRPDEVILISGDDGSWRVMAMYHKDWIPKIADALKEFK